MHSLAERLAHRIENGDFGRAVIGFTDSGYCVFGCERRGECVRVELECTPNYPGRGPTRSPFPKHYVHTIVKAVGAYNPNIYNDGPTLYIEWRPVKQLKLIS